MKKIEAIIRREWLDEVKTALDKIGVRKLVTMDVELEGAEVCRNTGMPRVMMTKVEFAVADARVQLARITVAKAAAGGDGEEGEIFVVGEVEDGAVRALAANYRVHRHFGRIPVFGRRR